MRSDMRLRFRERTVTFSSCNRYDSLHDMSCGPTYRTLNYERYHNETNRDQTNAVPAITGPEVIPRINPKLFRERKQFGVCR